jgi:hypothetical protein
MNAATGCDSDPSAVIVLLEELHAPQPASRADIGLVGDPFTMRGLEAFGLNHVIAA